MSNFNIVKSTKKGAVGDGVDNVFAQRQPLHYPLTRDKSSVVRLDASTRLVHVLSFNAVTSKKTQQPDLFEIDLEVAAFLAFQDFNNRNNRIIPNLSRLVGDCDIQLTLDARDTQHSPFHTIQQFNNALLTGVSTSSSSSSSSHAPPVTILSGPVMGPEVSFPLNLVAAAMEIPHIAHMPTDTTIRERNPYLGRIVPTYEGDGKALVRHYVSQGVQRFGVVHLENAYGRLFASEILHQNISHGLAIVTIGLKDCEETSIRNAATKIETSGVRYVFAILDRPSLPLVLEVFYQHGILGSPEYSWMFAADGFAEFTTDSFGIQSKRIAHAINGAGFLIRDTKHTLGLEEAMEKFWNDATQQTDFLNVHSEGGCFNVSIASGGGGDPMVTHLSQYYYDSMVAVGLAACAVDDTDLFSAQQFSDAFRALDFQGSSGQVRIEHGSLVSTGRFAVKNVHLDIERTSADEIYFKSQASAVIDLADGGTVHQLRPFIYADGTTVAPRQYPTTLEVDMDKISNGVLATGYFCLALVVTVCLCSTVFLCKYRKKPTVRASQPVFLFMGIGGTLLMALAILPLSLQEPVPQRTLNFACMSALWLFSAGFVTAFSSMFCKMYRLNKLRIAAKKFRRIVVRPEDVVYPFIILMVLNFAVLTTWTIMDPLTWTREPVGLPDTYGRVIATAGVCSSESRRNETIFFGCFIAVNCVALIFAEYQGFEARKHPKEFREIFYITLSFGCLLEGIIVGLPVLILVRKGNADAKFMVQTILILIVCLSILLPTFIPKYLNRNDTVRHKRRKITLCDALRLEDEVVYSPNHHLLSPATSDDMMSSGGDWTVTDDESGLENDSSLSRVIRAIRRLSTSTRRSSRTGVLNDSVNDYSSNGAFDFNPVLQRNRRRRRSTPLLQD